MDGIALLHEAYVAGLAVVADGDCLKVRGPRKAGPVARELIAHKATLLPILRGEPPYGLVVNSPADLPPDWRIDWEERAAIREYDGGQAREHAEAEALHEIVEQMRRLGWRRED